MKKKQMLEHWRGLDAPQPLRPSPVPYKHRGSTFDCDGLRITGSRKWIDSVLSQLSSLLEFENTGTRLQVVYKRSTDRKTGAELGAWNCYVQVHQRGDEAAAVNAYASALLGRQVIPSAGY